ncbi:hypothetical protein [Neobacillus cucumis]|uniref:hypothetical protein n=1 Tax=Neobacillus cucumis TaxID=1740721 RepID=UPI002E24003E|nr:hypothetical protein [Neobacillus cucumis]
MGVIIGGAKPKLNEEDSLEVIVLAEIGVKQSDLAKLKKVTGVTIRRVLRKDPFELQENWIINKEINRDNPN